MPDPVDFEWSDGESPQALEAKFETFDAALNERLEEALETLGLMIEGTAKTLVPVDSGRLKSRLSNTVKREGANIIALYVGSNVHYAPMVEYGRGAISASGDGVLHFTVDGEEVFVQSVGPAPAQPYLRPAIAQHHDDAKRLVREAVENAAEDAGLA